MSERDDASKTQHGQPGDAGTKAGRSPRPDLFRTAGGAAAAALGGLTGPDGGAAEFPAADAASPSLPAAPLSCWPLPGGSFNETFWDSTSFLKTKLYNEDILPTYRRLRPNYSVRYESIVRMVERVILNNADAEPALNQAAEEYVAALK